MSLFHTSPSRWIAVACVCFLVALSPLAAAPTVKSATLRFGGSPRLPVAEWTYLYYWLENPDASAVTVRLSLRASEHGRAVFEKSLTLAPGTTLHGREPVTADASSLYVLSLFRGTERLERVDVPVSSTDQPLAASLLFLNDAPEFSGTGDLVKAGLRDPVTVASVSARQAPHHWAAYGHTRLVVVVNPHYRDLTAAQFEALTVYVQRGGNVLFSHPDGTLAAAGTPWAALLPVVPLRVRRVEALPELDAWGAAWAQALSPALHPPRVPLVDRDGLALLESAEQGEGLTTLRCGTYPLVRWRRCGLGRVGIVATEPCDRRLLASGALAPLWNHFLTYAPPVFSLGNLENSHILPTVLAHLTGFRIPSARAVGWVLYGYVLLLAGLLLCGLLWRRQAVAWIVAAVVGLAVTTAIFAWALHQNAARPGAGVAVLDLRASTAERTSGNAVISLFTKKDLRPEVRAGDGATLLRPLPSPARGKRREPLDAPLIVDRQGDHAGLDGITVQALKPREFGALYSQPPISPSPITVSLGEGPAEIGTAVLPAVLANGRCRSFLLLPNALVPVSREAGRLTGIEYSPRLLETDPFLGDLARYLVDGAFPRPAVVVLAPVDRSGSGQAVKLPGFAAGGYTVHLLPATLEGAPGRIRLAPEFLRLQPAGVAARSILRDDPTRGSVLRMPALVLAYDVVLPAPCADLAPDEVTVELDLGNVGGNVVVEPRLVRSPLSTAPVAPDPVEAVLWQEAVAPTTTANGVYRFDGPRVATLVEPVYGRCRLLLRVSQKSVLTVATEAERANRWRLNRLRVAIAGRLPDTAQTRRF